MKFIVYNSEKNKNLYQKVFKTLKEEKFCIIKNFHSLNDHKKILNFFKKSFILKKIYVSQDLEELNKEIIKG